MEMIAGDTNQRNFTAGESDPSSQKGLAQKALGFNCLNYEKAAEGSLYRHFMPDKAYLDANCKDGIRAELMFPSCWNGKDTTSKNRMDHVAYPSSVMDGSCPEGFPTRLPGLFYETIWNTAEFIGVDGEFVFSNGDPTGYGYHGDFIMGWEEDFLQSAVDKCTNPSGRIEDCPLFTLQDDATSQQCQLEKKTGGILGSILAGENLVGPIPSLPGGVKLTPGPEYVVKGAPAGDESSTVVVPTLSHSAGSTIKPSETAAPGGIFKENNAANNKVAAPEPPTTTAKPTLSLAANQKVSSTSYLTQGGSVVEVIVIEELTTVTDEPQTKTVTASGAAAKRRAHRHGRHN
ncbi:hypothetical protein V492_06844 [Pseudogymnoascus sp. VKM F-4246]|nr:hypothetical protein V492_06844 [Pseudogymnoascus sp. VKM F-4246]